jgi:hypothetical protein
MPLGFYQMLRRSSCIIGVLVALATAQAADTTLTLACQGTVTTAGMEEATSMGIIINFTARTIQGFGTPGRDAYLVKITGTDDVTVTFGGSADWGPSMHNSISGSIDRVTGDMNAYSVATDPQQAGKIIVSTTYALKCRPTQRMF